MGLSAPPVKGAGGTATAAAFPVCFASTVFRVSPGLRSHGIGDFDMSLTNVPCKQSSAPELFHRNVKKRKPHKILGSSVFPMGDILLSDKF